MHAIKNEEAEPLPETKHEAIARAFNDQGLAIAKILDGYEVPEDKIYDIVEFGIDIQRRNPKMKPERIARKVVEYFKLKLPIQ